MFLYALSLDFEEEGEREVKYERRKIIREKEFFEVPMLNS